MNLLESFRINLYCKKRLFLKLRNEYHTIKNLQIKFAKEYDELIMRYHTKAIPVAANGKEINQVWVMWWQGEENMPDSIKLCHKSLLKNRNGKTINLITSENFSEYIKLPNYIIEKVNNGIISLTHLSDIVRVSILSEKGGLWLDATILVTKPLPDFKDIKYYTPKWRIDKNQYKKYRLWYGLWKITDIPKGLLTQCMGVWYSVPQNPIFQCLKDFWFVYWEKETSVDYYWTTEVFLLGNMYRSIDAVKTQILNLELNNPKCFDLAEVINKAHDENQLELLKRETQFFWLSRKVQYTEYTYGNGELTNYAFLKQIFA